MMKSLGLAKSLVVIGAMAALTACPAKGLPGVDAPGGGSSDLSPDSCGDYASSAGDVGRKVKAFLDAAVFLDVQTKALENSVKDACLEMGNELGLAGLEGDTKTVCKKVADELKANLQVSLKAEGKMVTKYKPAECTVKADVAARASAECEAQADVKAEVRCEGQCSGTCNGQCNGNCKAKNADGSCKGECEGTCGGTCEGSCSGNVEASGSAECQASAEVRANLEAECTPPEVEVTYEQTMVVDASKLEKATNAIKKGLPRLLAAQAKGKLVAKGIVNFGKTAKDMAGSATKIGQAFGNAALCVAGQIAAVAKIFVNVQVRVEVSVEASAEVGGAAGGSAG